MARIPIVIVALCLVSGAEAKPQTPVHHASPKAAPVARASDASITPQLAALTTEVNSTGAQIEQSVSALGPKIDDLTAAVKPDASSSWLKWLSPLLTFLSLIGALYLGLKAGPSIANRLEGRRNSQKLAIDLWRGTLDMQTQTDTAYRLLDAPMHIDEPASLTIRAVHDWFDGLATLARDPGLVDVSILGKVGVAAPMRDFREKMRTAHTAVIQLTNDPASTQAEKDQATMIGTFLSAMLNDEAIDRFLSTVGSPVTLQPARTTP